MNPYYLAGLVAGVIILAIIRNWGRKPPIPKGVPEYVPEMPFPGPVITTKVFVYIGEERTDCDLSQEAKKMHRQAVERSQKAKWN